MTAILEHIREAISQRQKDKVLPLTEEAIKNSIDPEKIIKDGLIPAMDEVGEAFGSGDIFLPEMLASAKLMKEALALVKPLIKKDTTETSAKILIGTVKGDLHDIGKNIVIMMLEGAGFQVVDLGVDISVEKIVDKLKEEEPQILGLSALLTTTMPELRNVINEISSQGLRQSIKIMVGGAPLDSEFAEDIGADGYGPDAAEAVKLAKRWI